MPRSYRPVMLALVAVLAFFVLDVSAQGSKEVYCSPQNTNTDDVYSWDYQSNGNCTNHCNQEGTFAFAVIKWKDCYCSNYAPSDQADLSRCAKGCPGFPAEHCGSFDDDLYIYLRLGGSPSGTAGAGGKPVQATSSAIVRPSNTPQPSQAPSEPQTSIQIIKESGATVIRTVIVTPPPSDPTSSSAPVRTGNEGGGSNVGAIAGGVAGGIVGLLAIVGIAVFFLWRRRRQQRAAQDTGLDGGGPAGITRNTSTMSKAGLLGGATDIGLQHPGVATQYGSQYSRYGADNQSTSSPTSNRRNSQPLIVDSRMNPEVYMEHAHANASRESVGTIDDSRDYARKLGVRNPDP